MTGAELPDFPASQLFLRRLAYRLVRDEGLAEDLVQDTWAAWVRHRPAVAEPRAWLARVLRNLAFNARRLSAHRAEREALVARGVRADPGEPETEGTLEAQAHLVAVLRALAEPYRSTLLQRYYHDLAPREIAERTGVPLETVKSRLARGLAKLREELDRRYGGDRAAWCHWLVSLGGPPAAAVGPAAADALARGPAETAFARVPRAVATVAGSPLAWSAFLALLAVGAVVGWFLSDPRDGVELGVAAEAGASDGLRAPLRPAGRVAAEGGPPAAAEADAPSLALAAAPDRPRLGPYLGFEWNQYGGGPTHVPPPAPDRIRIPRVAWHVAGAAGEPTLWGGFVYAGGRELLRIDASGGTVLERVGGTSELEGFVGSPVVTADAVLARRQRDGGITAYELDLSGARWSWSPRRPVADPWPACLDQGVVVLACGAEVVALRASDGKPLWTFRPENTAEVGEVDGIPAAADGNVYFATDRGVVYGLELQKGSLRLRLETGGWMAGSHPVLRGGGRHLLVADRGPALLHPGVRIPADEEVWPGKNDRPGEIWAIDTRARRPLWHVAHGRTALSPLAVGARFVVAGAGERLMRFDLDGGGHVEPDLATARGPFARPALAGSTVFAGTREGTLEARDVETGALSWAFRLPVTERVDEIVHLGSYLFVATSIGLFALAEDTRSLAEPSEYLLDWTPALALEVERRRVDDLRTRGRFER